MTPTRFQFASEKLVYPLKITQISVKDKTEALFYVQAPTKVDLKGDFSYQMTWVPMLQAGMGCTPGGIQGGGEQWLKNFGPQIPALMARARELGFNFIPGQRPQPGKDGCIPTTMEWSRKLTAKDVAVFKGDAPYSEKVPNVDEGFTQADLKDPAEGPGDLQGHPEPGSAKCQQDPADRLPGARGAGRRCPAVCNNSPAMCGRGLHPRDVPARSSSAAR